MRNNKALIALFVAVIVCLTCLFTACGDEEQDARDPQIVAIYDSYVADAADKGETPLSYEQWLESIKGAKGDKGDTGAQGNPGVDGKDGKDGKDGANGKDGTNGKDGANGVDGKSAYELWKSQAGNENKTEEEFFAFLKGEKGETGAQGAQGAQGIQGEKGDQGIQGEKGEKGEKGVDGKDGETYIGFFVDTQEKLLAALRIDNAYIVLLNDIEVDWGGYCEINGGKTITLNMNGKNITFGKTEKNSKGSFIVVNGGSLTIIGKGTIQDDLTENSPIIVCGSNDPTAENYSVVTIGKDVVIKAYECIKITYVVDKTYEYGIKIFVDGTLNAKQTGIYFDWEFVEDEGNVPEITLSETSVITTKSQGISASGYAIWNLSGNIITESTSVSEGFSTSGNALSFKSGIVTINGGTYKSTDAANVPAEGPSGYNKNSGAAICLISDKADNCPRKLVVTINGGTFESENCYGLLECISYSTNTKTLDDESSYTQLVINGGTFTGKLGGILIKDMDNKKVVFGGTFSTDPTAYLADGKDATENSGSWTVQ